MKQSAFFSSNHFLVGNNRRMARGWVCLKRNALCWGGPSERWQAVSQTAIKKHQRPGLVLLVNANVSNCFQTASSWFGGSMPTST